MSTNPHNLQFGQELYFVPRSRHGGPRFVTITKIGRKWAMLDDGRRIDIRTLNVDGGKYSSPGHCYLSYEAYEQEIVLSRAWSEFRRLIEKQMSIPDGLTVANINAASATLGFAKQQS